MQCSLHNVFGIPRKVTKIKFMNKCEAQGQVPVKLRSTIPVSDGNMAKMDRLSKIGVDDVVTWFICSSVCLSGPFFSCDEQLKKGYCH